MYSCHHVSLNSFQNENVSDKSCREIKTRVLRSVFSYSSLSLCLSLSLSLSNSAVYEIMCKNPVEPDRPLRIACRIPETANTHSEYVMLFAVPLQQLFGRRGDVLDDRWNHRSIPKRTQPSLTPKRELPVFRPSPYLCNEYREFLSPNIKRLGPEVDISPLFSSEVKNLWIPATISLIRVHGTV
jgi:hypothetical protein